MSKINLVSDVRLEKLKLKRRNYLITVSAICLLGTMLLSALIMQGYKWSRVYSLDNTKKKIASTNEELRGYKDIEDMVINIEQGIKAINEIQSQEPKWSKFLPVLEQVTPGDVRFTELNQDDNKFTAKAQGREVSSIARAIKSLEDYEYKENPEAKNGRKLFKNVNVDGYDKAGSLVSFGITFEIEKGILW